LGEFEQHDVLAKHCRVSDQVYRWSDLVSKDKVEKFSYDERRVIRAASAAGYRVGITIPLRISWNSHIFGMSFAKFGASDFAGHDDMILEHGSCLSIIARLFLTFFDMADEFRRENNLTNKEWEVVRTSMLHTSRNDQAIALGMKVNTLATHWANIFGKTGAKNQKAVKDLALAMGATPKTMTS
jgi:DNA-binding CsgD family transcriptional regulator